VRGGRCVFWPTTMSLPGVQLPPLRHELFERLFAGVQRRELAAPFEQPQMGAEVECILWCVEVKAAALAMHVSKPNAVDPVRGAVAPLAVADLHTRDWLRSARAQITDSRSSGGGPADRYTPSPTAAAALSLTGQRAPRSLPSFGADVRLTLCFALEALDWAICKEFSDLCFSRATHTLAQKSEGSV
jgi:hypothetical protein